LTLRALEGAMFFLLEVLRCLSGAIEIAR
jgi:hypothetical protein